MEIEVGDYIRTENGTIDKIIKIYEEDTDLKNIVRGENISCWKEKIVKHSKNITDLIEVGDILKIEEDDEIAYIGLERDTTTIAYQDIIDEIKNNKIKLLAIVTKEQYNQNCYRLEE